MKNAIQVKDRWKLGDAKARLSEVVRQAGGNGPQLLTIRGTGQAVVLSIADFHRMGGTDERPTLQEFFDSWDMPEIDLDRSSDHVRDVEV
jgi:prevent-host-death family protein